jgi:hypothetical protein
MTDEDIQREYLRKQLRVYCRKHGIDEVSSKEIKEKKQK